VAAPQRKPSIETIIKDPGKHFPAPRDVVADRTLSRDEKRRILESWALDAQLLAVAEEENMGGAGRPGLRDVKLALLELEERA
jgi:hypothetical protein